MLDAITDISYAQLAKTFYDFFEVTSNRITFYTAVVSGAVSSNTLNPKVSSDEVWHSLASFVDYVKQRCNNWPPNECPLLISMDEIHVLFDQRAQDIESDYTLFSRLKSVLNELNLAPLCTIFLSTATMLSQLAPPKTVASSMRERDDEYNLPPPFTELPFDAYVISDPLVPGHATLDSVGSLEFTAKFGRPL
jgi:hypothetical protein